MWVKFNERGWILINFGTLTNIIILLRFEKFTYSCKNCFQNKVFGKQESLEKQLSHSVGHTILPNDSYSANVLHKI